ncbi:fibronectin type III domain-containing protein [bacterium]|nr:fibronectin type III domain-containing protein [bacterium]
MKKLILILIILLGIAYLSAERESAYAISEVVRLNTIIPYHDESSFSLSSKYRLTSLLGTGSFAVSENVILETGGQNYSSLRVVPVAMAPNPSTIQIPESGYGYAWFALEGLIEGNWLPIHSNNIIAQDSQGRSYNCQSGSVLYGFLTAPWQMQNIGTFCIKIDANLIGDIGSTENFTITSVDGNLLSSSQTVNVEVVPIEFVAGWEYRLWSSIGVSANAGIGPLSMASVGVGIGGGLGSNLEIKYDSSTDTWNEFVIKRTDDLFLEANAHVGAPKFGGIHQGVSAEVEAGIKFPYTQSYEFDINDLEGVESLFAFYLMYEPAIIYAGSLANKQTAVSLLSWLAEGIIENSDEYNLGISRVYDQSGIDMFAGAGIDLGWGNENYPVEFGASASFGAEAHIGMNWRKFVNNRRESELYTYGNLSLSAHAGSTGKICGVNSSKFKLGKTYGGSLGGGFRFTSGSDHNGYLDKLKLEMFYNSDVAELNIAGMNGEQSQYSFYLEAEQTDLINLMNNAADLPSEIYNIGESAFTAAVDNNSFSSDISNILETIYEEQNDDYPVSIAYGVDGMSKSSSEYEIELAIPLASPLHLNFGTGLSFGDYYKYNLYNGYWVRGMPYLQSEVVNPPTKNQTFTGVMNELWDRVTSGDTWSQLRGIILRQLLKTAIGWIPGLRDQEQAIEINTNGSELIIQEFSIPTSIDSAFVRYWTWNEEPPQRNMSYNQRQSLSNFNRALRSVREEAVGMKYGIGGFYSLEPHNESFADTTKIRIKYSDAEITGLDESTLSVYWEDEVGGWHYLPSIVDTDLNYVEARITDFKTYTLAPALPQGQFGMMSNPDSLEANGATTAMITSDLITNNNGSLVEDGTEFTIQITNSIIITPDANLQKEGHQLMSSNGILQYEIQSGQVAHPIEIVVASINGFAYSTLTINQYDYSAPQAPINLSGIPLHKSILLNWEEASDIDLAGYVISYDTDQSGEPYNGTANVNGINSPITLGCIDSYRLSGLTNDQTYYITVQAFDVAGNVSDFSNEIVLLPQLNEVKDLSIQASVNGTVLNWSPVIGANSYKIYRSSSPIENSSRIELIKQTTATHYTDIQALNSDKYFYVVVVVAY